MPKRISACNREFDNIPSNPAKSTKIIETGNILPRRIFQ